MPTSRIRSLTTAGIAAAALLAASLLAAPAPRAEAVVGAPQVYVVPDGVTALNVALTGSAGFEVFCSSVSGRGGSVTATIPVTPGQTLQFNVATSAGGSASGNSSDIRRAPYTLADRLVVAGGGGQNADYATRDINRSCTGVRTGPGLGGDGGAPAGLAGTTAPGSPCGFPFGYGGGGGQIDGPGAGGTVCGAGGSGAPGTFGFGGAGGGSGTAVAPCDQGGGGGAGGTRSSVVGSPGGCTDASGNPIAPTIGGGGGGGSSYAVPEATNVVYQVGTNSSGFGGVAITPVTAPVTSVPSAPTNASAVGAATSATVSWVAPTSDGGSPITGYSLTVIPGGAVLNLGAAARSTVVTGLAPAVNYSFEITAVNAVGVGQPTTASALGTALTLRSSATSVTYGSTVKLTGNLTNLSESPLAGRQVKILAKKSGATTYTLVATATANASSVYAVSVKPTKGTSYIASFAGGDSSMGRTSVVALVKVKPKVSLALNDATATTSQTVFFSGTVSPNAKSQKVFLQRLTAGKWANVKSMLLTKTSTYKFAWRPPTGADLYFRVFVPARSGYLSSTTVKKILTVA